MKQKDKIKVKAGKYVRPAVSLLLAVLLLFGVSVPSAALQTPPFTGSEVNVITGDWMTEFTNYDITILGTHKWGQFRMMMTESGDPVYCIDWTTPSGKINKVKELATVEEWYRLDVYQKEIIQFAVLCGYPVSTLGQSANAAYMATQIVIWEAEACDRRNTDRDFHSPFSGWLAENSEVKAAYDSLLTAMDQFNKVPDFSAWDVCLEGIGTGYTKSITDRNNTISSYTWTASDPNVKVSVLGNYLNIYTDAEFSDRVTVTGTKSTPETSVDGFPLISAVCLQGEGTQAIIYGIPDPNLSVRISVTLEPRGGAAIKKTDENGSPLSGVTFGVYSDSYCNHLLGQIVTGNDGTAFYGISDGNYTVSAGTLLYFKELSPKDNTFVPDQGLYYVLVEANKINYANNGNAVINRPKTGILLIHKVAEDGRTTGTRFRITGTSDNGTEIDETVTIEGSDEALISLPIGSYTVSEIGVLSKYIPPEAQSAVIEWDQYTMVSFTNHLKRGNLTVTKTAEDDLTEGARFHLYGTSLSGLSVDEYAVVGSDGKAYFRDVLIGTGYVLEEVDTAIRYVVPEKQTAAIEWNKVTNKSFDNILKKWKLTVTKSDSEKGTAQGDASLSGAVYGIYKGEQLVDTYTTDGNGQFTTKYYVCGDNWSLREITPPEGYLLDPTVYHIGAEAKRYTVEYNSTALDSLETVQKGKISVIKHCDSGETQIETPEKGAEFEVYLKKSGSYSEAKESERDILVCDEFGFSESKDLPYGIYTVRQTKGWDGRELLPPFDVFVKEDGETYRYLINNADFESYIKIIKVDAETGKVIPYAGAGFQLYRPDGSLITQTFTYPTPTTVDTFYTNDKGTLITPEKLEYGCGYSIVEVSAPYGYTLNSDPVYFDVIQDASAYDGGFSVIEVVKENTAQRGVIKISKSGEIFSSVTAVGGGTIDENGNDVSFPNLYQPVYSVQGLAGAVYEIIATEDICTLDGTLRYAKGDAVAEITTGTDGTATTDPLYLGKFEVREKTAPFGMVISDEIHSVELTYAGQEVEITETATAFYNERQRAEISLSKVLEQSELFDIGLNGEILSVQFGLFAAEDLFAADGSVIPADGLLESVNCDKNGHAMFKTDIPVGAKLYVKEIATDSRYILSDEKYPVEFVYAGQDIVDVEIKVNDGNVIENNLIYGTIKGLKIDRETGETIAGALFGLFKADETEFTEETAVLTAKSQEDGVFVFSNIPFGNWIVVELMPAEGFLANKDIHHVHVTTDDEVIEITVVNDRIPEIETTASIDGEKQIHPNETITIEDEVEYKHLIPGREYIVKGVLMNKVTGEPFLVNNAEVRSEITFVPTEPFGSVIVTFTFDGNGITENTEIVAFESLYKDGLELTVHADIEDDGQTVTVLVPEICTTASVDGEKEVNATEVFTLEDVVSYTNLIPGKEYVLKGVLMDKVTGKALVIDGQEIHAETVFIPESPTGVADVEFTFDSKYIKADTDIVVFESLYCDGIELAVHANIENEGQTVKIKVPEIRTQATAEGKKGITASGRVVIEDIVSYKNLTTGKEYVLKGVLMDKTTGKPLVIDGQEIHSETVFIPKAQSGEVIVGFTFDSKYIKEDTDIVVFESLYKDGVEIAVHSDINDEGQTVKIMLPESPVSEIPPTEDKVSTGFLFGLAAIAIGGLISSFIIVIKSKKDEDDE